MLKRRPLLKKRILEEASKPEMKEGESEVVEEKEKSAEDEVRGAGTSIWLSSHRFLFLKNKNKK